MRSYDWVFDILPIVVMAIILFAWVNYMITGNVVPYGLLLFSGGDVREHATSSATSTVDNRTYRVLPKEDKVLAADCLARINERLTKLTQHCAAKYPDSAECLRLYKRYSPSILVEGSPDSGFTSYSVNKGDRLVLCIRQKSGEFVRDDVIMYVAIHELAHIMTREVGHTDAFWANFKFLVTEAGVAGVYTQHDFNKTPEEYCGIHINSSS